MSDKPRDRLYDIAESQAGYFTTRQALSSGLSKTTLRHHSRPGGLYERARRGLYRLRHFPSSPHEHVLASWLPLRSAGGVVSHESALDLYDLSDIIPNEIHVIVPRAARGRRPRDGVCIHSVSRSLRPDEIRVVNGMQVTSAERAILDSLQWGSQPDQIEMAVGQALGRGLITARRLAAAAATRREYVRTIIGWALEGEQCDIPAQRHSAEHSRTG